MNRSFRSAAAFVFGGLAWWLSTLTLPGAESPPFQRESDWAQSLGAAKAAFAGKPTELAAAAFAAYPRQTDWLLQDCGGDLKVWLETPTNADPSAAPWLRRSVAAVSGETGVALRQEAERLRLAGTAGDRPEWLRLYETACQARRGQRLAGLAATAPRLVFVRRFPVSPSFFAYTEGLSDAQGERHFRPGSELCVLRLDGAGEAQVETLLASPEGVIRDPAVSYDGQRLLFAWKKADRTDDYHLYEMQAESRAIRQLTFGLGAADYEPAYLPGGDIVFASSRCVQTVDCWWTEVSNLYLCNRDGKYLRRLSFDQVHAICPQVLEDGTVTYTRWDYNDRGQIWPQGLFRMNPDGSGQAEVYGNSSYFPTTIIHARGIPGTRRLLAVAIGHHTWQAGKLIEIDPAQGRQENEGVVLLAPRRPATPVRVDAYGQEGDLFRQPYPLSASELLVSFVPAALNRARASVFSLYWMNSEGERELLAQGQGTSCNSPVPLAPRAEPPPRPSMVDYRKRTGLLYVQDVYHGPGLAGVPRNTIKRLRVVALDFRAAGVQNNGNSGPAGGALVCTPVSINNGSWDVKTILGSATVEADGSAFFEVPARTPVYLQALDEKGDAVHTMRSWTTLQPGETQSCVGCHESKNETPPSHASGSLALTRGAETLAPFWGPPRGFSYIREIQPILDRSCVGCHPGGSPALGPISPSASYGFPNDSVAAICDGALPKNSDDHSIRRHTWWPHKGTTEWVQETYAQPRTVGLAQVYWFDDRPRGGGCRAPASWRLLALEGEQWQEVAEPSGYGLERDAWNTVRFRPVETTALRLEVKLSEGASGGVLEWLCGRDEAEIEKQKQPQLNLSGTQSPGPGGRRWSASYLSLTRAGQINEVVNWISAQSVPSLLPPYSGGAAKSSLLTLLRAGHYKAALTPEELAKLAAWIDLLIPYCGDYTEANAWSPEELRKYDLFQRKRQRLAQLEARHIEALLREQTGTPCRFGEDYTNVALNPFAGSENTDGLPRAESNSVCRGEACFAAANVIDGRPENRGHGPEFPSWGPDPREDLWLKLDFGGPVRLDRLDLWIRADFPHDSYWTRAVVEFSDGSSLPLEIAKTAERQSFPFPERVVEGLRFTRLIPADPAGWCGFSEVEAWGRRLPAQAAR